MSIDIDTFQLQGSNNDRSKRVPICKLLKRNVSKLNENDANFQDAMT